MSNAAESKISLEYRRDVLDDSDPGVWIASAGAAGRLGADINVEYEYDGPTEVSALAALATALYDDLRTAEARP